MGKETVFFVACYNFVVESILITILCFMLTFFRDYTICMAEGKEGDFVSQCSFIIALYIFVVEFILTT